MTCEPARRLRHARRVLLFFTLLSLQCAPIPRAPLADSSCPVGTQGDAARYSRLSRLIERAPAAASLLRTEPVLLCFGDGFEDGVIAGDIAFMSPAKSDLELAPRLAHLLVHHHDQLGDGCQKGLAAALASEQRAATIERQLRQLLGLSGDVSAHDAESDYRRRCADRPPASS